VNPVNSLIFHSIKTATQSHLQNNSLNWLDSACDNLVHPCNTLSWAAGNGLATEAMIAALRWADAALSPARTVCMIAPGNAASLRVAGKVGYRLYAKAEYKGSEVVLYDRTADRV
jgi:hypothetical protein